MANQGYDQLLPPGVDFQQGSTPVTRTTRYGEGIGRSADNLDMLAEDGELFMVTNATYATGVAQTANTTADTAKPFIFMIVPTTTKKFVKLHRLMMKPTAVSSGQTQQVIQIITSTAPTRTSAGTDYNQYASGQAAAGYRNLRSDIAPASVLSALWVGAPVTVLGTTPRLVAEFAPRVATIPVVNDVYVMNFGGINFSSPQSDHAIVASTTVNYYYKQCAPVIVGPGTGVMVVPYAASIGGAMSWEFELIWSER